MRSSFLATKLLGQPLAMLPSRADLLAHMLRTGRDEAAMLGPFDEEDSRDRGNCWFTGGICIIPVRGILLSGCGYCWSYATFYDNIRRAVAAAIADDKVVGIALLIDSPGGMVAGCFDLADALFAVRGTKPIWAILDEAAYSAAYALASACDRILVPRTGGTGSIGVVDMRFDITKMLEQSGIHIEVLQYGDRKTDRYDVTPLTDAAIGRLQNEVDQMGALFVDTVARNRKLKASAVRATQAGCFLGAAGVEAGLADAVSSPDEAFLALVEAVT